MCVWGGRYLAEHRQKWISVCMRIAHAMVNVLQMQMQWHISTTQATKVICADTDSLERDHASLNAACCATEVIKLLLMIHPFKTHMSTHIMNIIIPNPL